jgi:hypothetical protein
VPEDLQVAELVPAGGSWSGMLSDNPSIGFEPALHWAFTFEFREIRRDYGDTECHLAVEWVQLPRTSWRSMTPASLTCSEFGEPIESSVHFFDDYRFDAVSLTIGEQRGSQLHVSAAVEGDVDDLGISRFQAEGWLEFDGLIVALSDAPATVAEASEALASFTSTEGLDGAQMGHNFRFTPSPA